MSQKNYSEDQIIDVIKKILDTRLEIKKDDSLMAYIIDHTMKNRAVRHTISVLRDMPESPAIDGHTSDYMLQKIIKLLAIITEVIDNYALSKPASLKN
jgi:hypothetical protein